MIGQARFATWSLAGSLGRCPNGIKEEADELYLFLSQLYQIISLYQLTCPGGKLVNLRGFKPLARDLVHGKTVCSQTIMSCPHLHEISRLPSPRLSQSVNREECTQCFDSQVQDILFSFRMNWNFTPSLGFTEWRGGLPHLFQWRMRGYREEPCENTCSKVWASLHAQHKTQTETIGATSK